MDEDKYVQIYKMLGIPIQPLPSNYNPEEYGRRFLVGLRTERGVSYTASTDYVEKTQTNSNINIYKQERNKI